jgi:hypothetical protein
MPAVSGCSQFSGLPGAAEAGATDEGTFSGEILKRRTRATESAAMDTISAVR